MTESLHDLPRRSSLDTGLRILTLLAQRESVTVTSAATALGISRSSAYRTLHTLRSRGFLALGPAHRGYFPGPAMMELARPTRLDSSVRERLRPIIDDALYRTGETVHVAALIGSQVLLFDGRESERPLRAGIRIGYLRPAYAMTAGKLFLSRLIPEQARALFPDEELAPFTRNTTPTVTRLIEELAVIAEHDYHISYEEIEDGLNGVSVLLEGTNWRNRIALVSSVPTHRSDPASMLEVKERLKESVKLLQKTKRPTRASR